METIKKTRKKMKLRQVDAARRAQVVLSTWQRWERTGDAKAWEALGMAVPADAEPATGSRVVNLNLSPGAFAALASIPNGQRSRWVSMLLESAGISPTTVDPVA